MLNSWSCISDLVLIFNFLNGWAKTWWMVFLTSKCYTMHIHPDKDTQVHLYHVRGTVLSCIASEKYLRVYIWQDSKWSQHIIQVASQAEMEKSMMPKVTIQSVLRLYCAKYWCQLLRIKWLIIPKQNELLTNITNLILERVDPVLFHCSKQIDWLSNM